MTGRTLEAIRVEGNLGGKVEEVQRRSLR